MTKVIIGGEILIDPTPNQDTASTTTAIAFQNGLVIAHGDEALALIDSQNTNVQVIDLEGGTLVPAVGEGHAHPMLGGQEALGPAVRQAADLAGIVQAVKDFKDQNPDNSWIVGASYDSTLAPGGLFDAAWLDEVTGDTPTILRSWDYHTAWVNSAALAAGGVTSETPDPELGRYVRRADGSIMGTLQETAANNFLADVVPPFTIEERVTALENATKMYAAQGTTWVQDAWVDPVNFEVYLEAARQKKLHTRLNLAFRADPVTWHDQVEKFKEYRETIRALSNDRLSDNRLSGETIKFFLDGVIESHTAALIEPYADRPHDSGIANWEAENLFQAMRAFAEAGFQLHLHAIGDAANRLALTGLEHIEDLTVADRPHVIAHVAVVHPEDRARFAKLNVIANFQPYWAQCDQVMQDLTIPHIGHDREGWQYLIGSLKRSGAQISFGSDWPVSTPDWRPALATAVTRRDVHDPEDQPWLPDERISAREAFAAYTTGIAAQALAKNRGTLEIGFVADAMWMSGNPVTVAPEEIPHLKVLRTWLAGEEVFKA